MPFNLEYIFVQLSADFSRNSRISLPYTFYIFLLNLVDIIRSLTPFKLLIPPLTTIALFTGYWEYIYIHFPHILTYPCIVYLHMG